MGMDNSNSASLSSHIKPSPDWLFLSHVVYFTYHRAEYPGVGETLGFERLQLLHMHAF